MTHVVFYLFVLAGPAIWAFNLRMTGHSWLSTAVNSELLLVANHYEGRGGNIFRLVALAWVIFLCVGNGEDGPYKRLKRKLSQSLTAVQTAALRREVRQAHA